jgi:VanZ family protein
MLFVCLRRWGPAVGVMAVIFIASSIPSAQMPRFNVWDVLVKKGGHFMGYALLAALYMRGLAFGRRATRRDWGAAVLLAVLYALTDEFHQRFVPGRGATLMDVGIDTAGALVGAPLLARWVT